MQKSAYNNHSSRKHNLKVWLNLSNIKLKLSLIVLSNGLYTIPTTIEIK